MVELTHRNTRRYGGYLVHMGIVLMFIGFTGKAFDKDLTEEVAANQSVQLGKYTLRIAGSIRGRTIITAGARCECRFRRTASDLGTLEPERRFYAGIEAADLRSRHSQEAERGLVHQLRRHLG